MKKLILLLFAISANAQEINPYVSFSAGIDIRNATLGSAPTNNKPEPDIILGFQMVSYNKVEVGCFYENFKRIGFERYEASAGYQFQTPLKTTLTTSVLFAIINRGPVEQEYIGNGSFLSYGASFSFLRKVSGNLHAGIYGEIATAPDLVYLGNPKKSRSAVYLEFVYKIKI